jgi:hypothetical protein
MDDKLKHKMGFTSPATIRRMLLKLLKPEHPLIHDITVMHFHDKRQHGYEVAIYYSTYRILASLNRQELLEETETICKSMLSWPDEFMYSVTLKEPNEGYEPQQFELCGIYNL